MEWGCWISGQWGCSGSPFCFGFSLIVSLISLMWTECNIIVSLISLIQGNVKKDDGPWQRALHPRENGAY
jgi:hypothetical protein